MKNEAESPSIPTYDESTKATDHNADDVNAVAQDGGKAASVEASIQKTDSPSSNNVETTEANASEQANNWANFQSFDAPVKNSTDDVTSEELVAKSEDGHIKVENGSVDESGRTKSESAAAEEGEGMSEARAVTNQKNADEKQSSEEVKVENQTPNCKQCRLVNSYFLRIHVRLNTLVCFLCTPYCFTNIYLSKLMYSS